MTAPQTVTSPASPDNIQFLWLELTNVCNLQCVHCYADSSPFRKRDDLLGPSEYNEALATTADFGCKRVQFIGGEPTLNRNLPDFIRRSRQLGYEFVEVFTNLTRLSPELLGSFVEHNVSVATSVYADEPHVHDEITKKPGSFAQTMRNIDAVVEAGLPLRAGVISMPLNEDRVEDTLSFLRARGVKEAGSDRVRDFGRASGGKGCDRLDNLCGKCAGPTLCVSPSGAVSPCIMSKTWSVGSMLETPLAQLITSSRLTELRKQIFESTARPQDQIEATGCEPACSPSCYPSCQPACSPSCVPSCVPSCAPSCYPSCAPACTPSR